MASQRVNVLWLEPKEFSHAWPIGQVIGPDPVTQNRANLPVTLLFHEAEVLLAETVTLVSAPNLDLEELHSRPSLRLVSELDILLLNLLPTEATKQCRAKCQGITKSCVT
jgi:hypothetical protein